MSSSIQGRKKGRKNKKGHILLAWERQKEKRKRERRCFSLWLSPEGREGGK